MKQYFNSHQIRVAVTGTVIGMVREGESETDAIARLVLTAELTHNNTARETRLHLFLSDPAPVSEVTEQVMEEAARENGLLKTCEGCYGDFIGLVDGFCTTCLEIRKETVL